MGSVFIPIAFIVLNVALLVWVARDAKARGMDSAVVWMILVMFTSVLGLVIYIFSRPQGNLIRCPSCGNQRLQASAKCPHCGNASRNGQAAANAYVLAQTGVVIFGSAIPGPYGPYAARSNP